MAGPNIVVVGASAGGLEPLTELLRGLPPDFPGSLFVVVHFPSYATSTLPQILRRSSALARRSMETSSSPAVCTSPGLIAI